MMGFLLLQNCQKKLYPTHLLKHLLLIFFNDVICFPFLSSLIIMFTLDTLIGQICQPLPLQGSQLPPEPQLCLSYILLILIYSSLLYKYISTFIKLFKLQLYSEMDSLDKTLIGLAVLRLLNIYLLLLDIDLAITIPLLILVWDFLILSIFMKFVFESMLTIKRICVFIAILFVVYVFLFYTAIPINSDKTIVSKQSQLIIPVFYPLQILNICILLICIYELWNLTPIFRSIKKLQKIIRVQLKNRYSFVLLLGCSSLLAHLLMIFPQILKETIGTVLYFILLDWVSILIVYICIPSRVMKENTSMEYHVESVNSRNSSLIEVELCEIRK